jgi:hypothetical protein
MKTLRLISTAVVLTLAGITLAGCSKQHDASGHGHNHGAEAAAGASFKPGKGVILTDETRRSLGVETAEVTERKLPLEIRFAAQVFGEDHKPTAAETYHAECTAKAAGLLPQDKAAEVRPGQAIQLVAKKGESLGGVVLGVNKALAIGDIEVVVGITNSGTQLKPGDFLSASISIPREQAVAVVPNSAVLRTAEGTFVYALNGSAYFRTPVKTGSEAEGFVEITDGLFSGDVVVTKPIERLWLIELRATKGGGHSH